MLRTFPRKRAFGSAYSFRLALGQQRHRRVRVPVIVQRHVVVRHRFALEFIDHFARILFGRDDQALRQMPRAVVDIDQPAQVRRVFGVERKTFVPIPENGECLI